MTTEPPKLATSRPWKKSGLAACADCSNTISRSAVECPHCGHNYGERFMASVERSFLIAVSVFVGVLAAAMVIAFFGMILSAASRQ